MLPELSVSVLAYIALCFYVVAMLARQDIVLCMLVLCGTVFYMLYYFLVADSPLWDPIITNGIIALANVYTLSILLLDRTTLGFTPEMRALYRTFPTLTPGQFKRLIRKARWGTVDQATVLCREGEGPQALYYVIEGPLTLDRAGRDAAIASGQFIAELSFQRGPEAVANATVTAGAGTRYVAWDRAELRRMLTRSLPLSNALAARFNADMVDKLDRSFPDQPAAPVSPAAPAPVRP